MFYSEFENAIFCAIFNPSYSVTMFVYDICICPWDDIIEGTVFELKLSLTTVWTR